MTFGSNSLFLLIFNAGHKEFAFCIWTNFTDQNEAHVPVQELHIISMIDALCIVLKIINYKELYYKL